MNIHFKPQMSRNHEKKKQVKGKKIMCPDKLIVVGLDDNEQLAQKSFFFFLVLLCQLQCCFHNLAFRIVAQAGNTTQL